MAPTTRSRLSLDGRPRSGRRQSRAAAPLHVHELRRRPWPRDRAMELQMAPGLQLENAEGLRVCFRAATSPDPPNIQAPGAKRCARPAYPRGCRYGSMHHHSARSSGFAPCQHCEDQAGECQSTFAHLRATSFMSPTSSGVTSSTSREDSVHRRAHSWAARSFAPSSSVSSKIDNASMPGSTGNV